MWTNDQVLRLQYEWEWLTQKWPGWNFVNNDLGAVFSIDMRTNGGTEYPIQIIANYKYPDKQPRLYVKQKLDGIHGASAETHTLSWNDALGQEISGYRTWTPNNIILPLALRIREWLEAYEIYQATGKQISSILD